MPSTQTKPPLRQGYGVQKVRGGFEVFQSVTGPHGRRLKTVAVYRTEQEAEAIARRLNASLADSDNDAKPWDGDD